MSGTILVGETQTVVTVEELEATYDVLARLVKIKVGSTDWYVLMATRDIVSRAKSIAKYGYVPGEAAK